MPTREQASTGFSSKPHSCQPGAIRLQQYLMAQFGVGNSGCLNPLSTLSGGGPSWHQYGKAIDMTANYNDPASRARGDRVFDWVLAHKEDINLQQMIWGHSIYDVSYNAVHPYNHSDHENHVHIAIGYAASQNWQPSGTPTPTPGDDDMFSDADRKLIYDMHHAIFGEDQNPSRLRDLAAAIDQIDRPTQKDVAEMKAMVTKIQAKLGA